MNLKAIFSKPVDRSIEGVIKADDDASLRLELEEYVLTNEVEKRLERFLSAYNTYEGTNGVWISGFFGSGKSHLLKMLALILENREVDGIAAFDLFLPKCGDNEILRGDLKRAVGIPSRSILFNIDQKADVISKTQMDALLAVFVKVFDEMCGYYGKQGHIAQFERDLHGRGLYQRFKAAFAETTGTPWERGREQALLESKNIAVAYAQVTDEDPAVSLGILDRYRSQYRVSIEDFAEKVLAYIEHQPPRFRLNFFVDEVGQYIADNTKLMTNLQTIAESLATKCRGRAWILVTAQEEMRMVVGDMSKQQGNDFSKIQARFATRMKLTSADVAEVIQKRLLLKNDLGVRELSDIHHRESNNFKTLFDFADGAKTYRNFLDREHFIHSYPFIPYQFALFQSAIQNLSQHNAFEGKHSSVGERSMLGVFQQVAIQIGSHEVGQLATFDQMFEGIRTALKSNIQRAVIQAETHLSNAFAVRLLKALFLVKYVKEFKATPRNLCVLVLDRFDQNIPELRRKVEEVLGLLEQQTYIQRDGDLYAYLTDEEKDVEQEIKDTEVESTDVATELEKLIFDQVLKTRKIRDDNRRDYPFSRKLDDRLYGREYELAIHVISPFHEHAENESILKMHSMGRDELLVFMPPDSRLMRDLLMYKRTEKYVRQNMSTTQQDSVKRILADKGFQNRARFAELRRNVQNLLGKAKLLLSGGELEISSEDPLVRITRGFQELIIRAYPNLRMLRGISYSERDLSKYLDHTQPGLFGNAISNLEESEQEVLAFVQSNNRTGVRTTMKNLLEKFEHKPYGWDYAAVLCTLAKLCVRGKIEVRVDGNLLEAEVLERALRNTHGHGNVVLEPQVEFTASQVRALKEFYNDFFDGPPSAREAKALGQEMARDMVELVSQLNTLSEKLAPYPFRGALQPVLQRLSELSARPYSWYLTELGAYEDSLLDLKESLMDPLKFFMNGPQKKIFDEAIHFVQQQEPNFSYIRGDEPTELKTMLADPGCFKGNHMFHAKAHLETVKGRITAQLAVERSRARKAVSALEERLRSADEFSALTPAQQQEFTLPFAEFSNELDGQTLIAVIRDGLRRFEDSKYQRLLVRMASWSVKPPAPAQHTGEDRLTTSLGTVETIPMEPKPTIEYVSSRSIRVDFDKVWLADEADVERYLKSMRKALLAEIIRGKRIQI